MNMVKEWLHSVKPERGTVKGELVAGLPGAIGSVPDGMAMSVLVGVNPVHGLYASFAGPIGGGLTASTRLMVITTTSASALAAGSALEDVPASERPRALFLLTVIAGALMIAAGVLRLGRYTRFVPYSVMIGFLTGVGANIVFSQTPDIVGTSGSGDFAFARFLDVLRHPGRWSGASLLVGASALALIVVFSRIKQFAAFSAVIALAIPTIIVTIIGSDRVAKVADAGAIPRGLPVPTLPHFGDLSFSILFGAVAIAALVLVQGSGVSESAPNPATMPTDQNQDFIAQGIGNVAAGLLQGQPVGGSVGQTALNRAAGAKTRWASIFSGVWMAAILVAFSGIVGKVAMPTLAAVLIFAAIGSLRFGQIEAILRTGRISQIAFVATFIATLVLPVAAAVGLGVVLSLMMQLNQEALDLKVVELVPTNGSAFEERPVPDELSDRQVTMLDIYGSLFYAGARTLQVRLPDPATSEGAAVVLRMRGRTTIGATCVTVLEDYARRLADTGGRLFISGVDPDVLDRMRESGIVGKHDLVEFFTATSRVGASSFEAYDAATAWVAEPR